jgi:hypothetical protein
MFDNINFDIDKPYFVDGTTKWFYSIYLNDYIVNKQSFNLLELEKLYCFIVKGEGNINDLVLIDDKQNVMTFYNYSHNGYEQMIAFINMLKISKYYDRV